MPSTATHTSRSHADSTRPEAFPPGWRGALLRGLDAVVAFATLRDAELPDPAPSDRAGGPAHAASHPHRRPLRAPSRARRPGVVAPARQACTTPLAPRHSRRLSRTTGHRS
jgi:hypothetical protein